MVTNIKKRSISLMLLNARITDKSFKRWKIFTPQAKIFFRKFDICLSANTKSKNYLKLLGVKKIKYIGNLKFSQTEKNNDNLKVPIKKFFMSKKIWCAASTHDNEEKICALVHKKLKKKYKNLLTIIIPRHVSRSEKIMNEIQKLGLTIHEHESKNKINSAVDVYLVNSYGKTKSFFKVCKTVFLGGSLIKHGGQNPLEAVRYGCKILHGPSNWNFREIYELLSSYKVSTKVKDIRQLTRNVDIMLSKTINSKNIESKIKNLGNKILNSTLNEINFFINKK